MRVRRALTRARWILQTYWTPFLRVRLWIFFEGFQYLTILYGEYIERVYAVKKHTHI